MGGGWLAADEEGDGAVGVEGRTLGRDIGDGPAPAAANTIHGEKVRGPYFNGPGEFAVHFTFEVTPKATGKRVTLEEVGVYTVKGDKITREQFFYDGER